MSEEMKTNVEMVPLTIIDANPYQPREREDPEHIQRLAASIGVEGLLQIPTARRVGERVQLAFGHSRLAAYWLLYTTQTQLERGETIAFEDDSLMAQVVAQADARLERGEIFRAMPLALRELGDEDMFRQAVRENIDRADLSPIEQARAMKAYRDTFGKTSAQIGALFGLSESAVRNKIRLLELPQDVREQLAGRNVSELVLRELLPLFDLPQSLIDRAEAYGVYTRKSIVAAVMAGEIAEQIHNRITNMVDRHARSLSKAPWKFEQELTGAGIVGLCKDCPHKFTRARQPFCALETCYNAKQLAFRQEYLQAASQATGIPVHEDPALEPYAANDFGWGEDAQKTFETIQATGCSNLRVMYAEGRGAAGARYAGRVEGFEHALVVCKKRNGFCTCQKAMEVRPDLLASPAVSTETTSPDEPVQDDHSAAAAEPERAPAAPRLTAEDLKRIDQAARREQRENRAKRDWLCQQAAVRIMQGLIGCNAPVWRNLLRRLDYTASRGEKTPDTEVILGVARWMAAGLSNPEFEKHAEDALAIYNRFLAEAGLETITLPAGQDAEVDPPKPLAPDAQACPDCGGARQRKPEADGWVWLHCPSCDKWESTEERTGDVRPPVQ